MAFQTQQEEIFLQEEKPSSVKKKQAELGQESDEENVMEVKEFRVNEDRSRVHHDQ